MVRTVVAEPHGSRARRSRAGVPVAAAALVCLTVIAYAPALRGGFVWDDDAYVSANVTLRSPDGLRRIWAEPGAVPQYYPLVHTVFWLEYRLWGAHPAGYHAVNVLLHVLNALLLWWVLRRLRVSGGWLVAALFAVHPVHTESVAWITERKNVLSGFFYLLSLHAYLSARPLEAADAAHVRWSWYAASLAAFACALLSKTVVCSLPAVVLLLIWWQRGRVTLRDVRLLAPFFVLGGVLAAGTVWMEKYHVGARGVDFTLSWTQRALLAGRVLWFYAGKLCWPQPLMFSYPRWTIDPRAWPQYLWPAAVAAVVVGLFLARSRLGRGPLVAVLCFAGTLAPALGFVDVYPMRFSFVADHFQYLASIGVLALVVGAAVAGLRSITPRWPAVLVAVSLPALAALTTLTWQRTHIYADRESLWRDTLAKNPASWIAHNNLATLLLEDGRIDEAMRHLDIAVQLKDDPVTEMGLALARAAQGHTHESLALLRAVADRIPDDPRAHFNLGAVAARTGDWAQAAAAYTAAIRLKPDDLDARRRLADVLLSMGRPDEAGAQCLAILRLDPGDAEAYDRLGVSLTMRHRLDDAIGAFREAVRLKPDLADAYTHWGVALSMQAKRDAAIDRYREALRHNPASEDARHNLREAEAEAQ
jgi:tetratricopeptide (TPR) repeat protein